MKEGADLRQRTKEFALRVIRMFGSLPNTAVAQILGKQALRSGTSCRRELPPKHLEHVAKPSSSQNAAMPCAN